MLFIVMILSLAMLSQSSFTLPQSEYDALYDLYNSTQGKDWIWKKPYSSTNGYPWTFVSPPQNPCSSTTPWQYIKCTSDCQSQPCNIEKLLLSNNNMQGQLPDSLGCFTQLAYLDIQANYNLVGPIPSTIGNLQNLTTINLNSNGITGPIPTTLSNLSELMELYIFNNQISGSIPVSLGDMNTLQQLYIENNQYLTGTIPSSLGSLNNLNGLSICNNPYISGSIPSSLGSLSSLQTLVLCSDSMTGTIPSALGSLIELQSIFFSGDYGVQNALTGTIPTSFQNLKLLNSLTIQFTLLSGSIPDWFGKFQHLQTLYLNNNQLTGTIPLSICNLSTLSWLDASYNRLVGSIPSTLLSDLNQLQSLELAGNQLSGEIPSLIGNLPSLSNFALSSNQLSYLDLHSNMLTASIPASLGKLSSLSTLDLDTNMLTGSIPSSIGNLTMLSYLNLDTNMLTGSIPSSFGNLVELTQLILFNNILIGHIPPTIGNLTMLSTLDFSTNMLTGSIPSSFGNFRELEYLALFDNLLTGTIPTSLGDIYMLSSLDLDTNKLTGTIPSSLGKLIMLQYIDFDTNMLSGTIPSAFGNIASNAYIYMYNNLLTGSIPLSFGNLTLSNFYVANNAITGTIPQFMSNWYPLVQLDVSANQLTGSLPSIFGNMTKLEILELSSNFLTGTLPTSLNHLHVLEGLFVSNNTFSGQLPSVKFRFLEYLDVSYNHFTGKVSDTISYDENILQLGNLNNNAFSGAIPSFLFTSKKLLSVVLSSNCFSGTLPDTVCSSSSLAQLVLDGLHSSPSCLSRPLGFIPNAGVVINSGVYGTIPSCLLQLPNISVLHLGGNSFSGSIPNVPITNSLTNIVFANNELTGTVSNHLWYSNVISLDISFNRLEGTLPHTMLLQANNVNATINLRVNQLSGTVPSVLCNLPANQVNVLEGNMFSCNADRSDIPSNDPNYDSYDCGSDSTNYSLICFGVAITVIVCLLILATPFRKTMQQLLFAYDGTMQTVLNGVLMRLYRFTFLLCGMFIVVGMLLFGTLSIDHSTYSYMYVWAISGVYKTHIVAAVMLLLWFISIIVFISWWLSGRRLVAINSHHPKSQAENNPHGTDKLNTIKDLLSMALVLFNICVVLVVNGLYVSAIHSGYNSKVLMIFAIALSIFKWCWGFLFVEYCVHVNITTIVGIYLFNNLVAPLLAEMFVSSDCFLYLVSQAPSLTLSYIEYGCVTFIRGSESICNLPIDNASISIDPPFHYSYQCSFSLISSYAYVFVFRYLLSGIINPFVLWILRTQFFPLPIKMDILAEDSMDSEIEKLEHFSKKKLRPRFVAKLVTDLSTLIAFGVVFPPLALVIGLSIWQDLTEVKLVLGRFQLMVDSVTSASLKKQLLEIRDTMCEQYVKGASDIAWGVWYGLCISCVIWAFILFDTLSSSEGMIDSIWIVVVMVLSPYIVYGMIWGYQCCCQMYDPTVSQNKDIILVVDGATKDVIVETKNPIMEERDVEMREC